MTTKPLARPLPVITEMNSYFWCGGKDGRLHIQQCGACSRYAHPYVGRCPSCRKNEMAPQPVSGKGRIVGMSINYLPWFPHVPVPYVVAIVTIVEQDDIYLVTDIVGYPAEDVSIGMSVEVVFEQYDDIFIPLFKPA